MISLSEFLKKYPHFSKYYEFLKDFLPSPDEIKVGNFHDLKEEGVIARETVMACAIQPDRIYFRHIPPDDYTFVHEMIHLCKKYNEHEEVYAYNLADAVIYLAENGTNNNVDIFYIFELKLEDIEKVLKEMGFNSIEEFYEFVGIIPSSHTVEDGRIVREKFATDKDVVITFVSEATSGLEYFDIFRQVFDKLILLCCKKL